MLFNKQTILPITALAGSCLAQASSGGSGAECTRSYASLLLGAPTPTGPLGSALTSYASSVAQNAGASSGSAAPNPLAIATQVCDFSSQLPNSLQSEFDAYATSVISYVSASSADIDAVITNCLATGSEGAAYTSIVNSLATHTGPLCSGSGSGGGGTATGTPSFSDTVITPTPTSTGGEGGGSGGGSGETSSVPTAAAAQPTAFLGGVAAAAGLLGAVALL